MIPDRSRDALWVHLLKGCFSGNVDGWKGSNSVVGEIVCQVQSRPGTGQDRFLLSNSDLRFANGEWVAPPRPAASVPPPPVASSCRWCSLSWQYRHSNSQLLPSGGLLP